MPQLDPPMFPRFSTRGHCEAGSPTTAARNLSTAPPGRPGPAIRSPLARQFVAGLVLLCCGLIASPTAWAQVDLRSLFNGPDEALTAGAPARPTVAVELSPVTDADLGSIAQLRVTIQLPTGYYILDPRSPAGNRTQLKLTEIVGAEVVDGEFLAEARPKVVQDPDLGELWKHPETLTVTTRLRSPKPTGFAAGDLERITLRGSVTGQYCNDGPRGRCIPLQPPLTFAFGTATADDRGDGDQAPPEPAARESVTELPRPELPWVWTERPQRRKNVAADPVEFEVGLSSIGSSQPWKAGDLVRITVMATMDPEWHIFSLTHQGEGGTATEIEITSISGLEPVDAAFQPDDAPEIQQQVVDAASNEVLTLEVHEDRVAWYRAYRVTDPSQIQLTGSIRYQVCKTVCLPPYKVKFALPAGSRAPSGTNGAGSTSSDPTTAGISDPSRTSDPRPVAGPPNAGPVNPGVPTPPVASAATPSVLRDGFLAFVLAAMISGALALLTPCVFPMMPITVSFFLKQAGQGRTIPLAITYCGSIIGTFTLVGVATSALFGASALNQFANHPWFNVFLGVVFVAFGLMLLGMFEIHVPSSWLTYTAVLGSQGGYLGAIFMGVTFALTSFTCTFAFAGQLLVLASQGHYLWPILGMLIFSTTFAAPFFLLSLFPSWLHKLPKGGGWLNTVKVVMGLIEVAFALKFFSVADAAFFPVPVFFTQSFVMVSWIVLSAVAGLYLLGVFRLASDTPIEHLTVMRLMNAMLFLGFAALLSVAVVSPERSHGWLAETVLGFAPPDFSAHSSGGGGTVTDRGGSTAGGSIPVDADIGPTLEFHQQRVALDFEKAAKFAERSDLPIFVDFTGVNCSNCRVMEKRVLSRDDVLSRLRKMVPAQLFTDKVPLITDPVESERLTKFNSDLQSDLIQDLSLPSYVVLSPDGRTVLAKFIGMAAQPTDFTQFLDQGLAAWNASRAPKTAEVAPISPPARAN